MKSRVKMGELNFIVGTKNYYLLQLVNQQDKNQMVLWHKHGRK